MAREKDGQFQVTFKATDIGYEVMRDMEGLRPAPYLASRGMKWIQHFEAPGLDNAGLKDHIEASYHCLLYTSPSPRDATLSRMPSSA